MQRPGARCQMSKFAEVAGVEMAVGFRVSWLEFQLLFLLTFEAYWKKNQSSQIWHHFQWDAEAVPNFPSERSKPCVWSDTGWTRIVVCLFVCFAGKMCVTPPRCLSHCMKAPLNAPVFRLYRLHRRSTFTFPRWWNLQKLRHPALCGIIFPTELEVSEHSSPPPPIPCSRLARCEKLEWTPHKHKASMQAAAGQVPHLIKQSALSIWGLNQRKLGFWK